MKGGLRTQFRATRDALGARARHDAAQAIGRRLGGVPEYAAARRVIFYASFGSEVDTSGMIAAAHHAGRQVVLPRIEGKSLVLHEFRPGDPLVANPFGIPEPSPSTPVVALDRADAVLVPGLAFDRRGHRLGYGGGYYDRLLRTSPHAFRIGLGYELQVVERLPITQQDEGLDALITDLNIHVYPKRYH